MSAVLSSRLCRGESTRRCYWTKCQCGLSCNVGWTGVWLQTPSPGPLRRLPTTKRDHSPPRRSETLVRHSRTPDRRPRTPIRRARVMDESRDSTCSRSPIRRSSSSESGTRDTSPVNFSAALNTEDKVKDRTIFNEEDDDGTQKKVSAAQYQLFRQAVTSSKGSFKITPFKSRRAPRASLMDLGETESSDRVSWLDQPYLVDTMASTVRIAQGLKDEEEVEKTTLSETLNTSSSTFKHLSVKQIFPRELYRLKVHRDALYLPKPPAENGFSDNKAPASYQISQQMVLDTEELARRWAIYALLADSMVASVIEELSPKDQKSKLLLEKLTIIQEAHVSAVSARLAAASNLQLLRRDVVLKNFGFQPQVLSTVRTAPFEGSHVLGPEPKVLQNRVRAIRQANRMAGSSVTFVQKTKDYKTNPKVTSAAKKSESRTSVFNRLGSAAATTGQKTVTQEQSFRGYAGRGARHRPYLDQRSRPKKSTTASSAGRRWRSSGGGSPCRLRPALEESAGQLLGHRHCRGWGGSDIPTKTSTDPPVHQLPDQEQPARPPASCGCLAVEGGHRAGHQRDIPRYYSRLFLVPEKTGDLRPVINLSTLNRHMVVPHFKMETQGSVGAAIRSQEWTVSIDIRDAYLHVPMHQAVRKYLRFVVNKKVYQFTCLPFGLATSPPEFTKLLRPVVAMLRRRGVTSRLLRRLADPCRYSRTGAIACPDSHQGAPVSQLDHQLREVGFHSKSRIPVHRDAVQHSANSLCRPYQRCVSRSSPFISTVWPTQTSQPAICTDYWVCLSSWLHWYNGEDSVFDRSSGGPPQHGARGPGAGPTRSQFLRQWVLSEVAWWASPAVLQGLPLAAKETEVTLFMDASSSGWGAQVGSRSTQGQWSASQRSWHINVLEMQAVINAVRDFLPHLRSRVVRLMCDNAVTVAYIKNEGGTRSYTLMQMTIRLLKWCDRKAITLVPVHLPGVHNIQADSLSRVGQTLNTGWTMAMELLRPVFAKWGEPQVDLFATFANRWLIKFVSPYPDPRAEWTDAMSVPWDNGRGLLYAFPPFKMVPQVLQKIAQSPGVRVILIAPLQQAAAWFPELMDLAQDPIPLFVEGQDLLTQDVLIGDGVTETRHYWLSNIHTRKLYGPSWGRRAIPGKLLTWCQGPFVTHPSKCMNPIGQDSWHSVGKKYGMCFESEVIISALIWCTSSETDY